MPRYPLDILTFCYSFVGTQLATTVGNGRGENRWSRHERNRVSEVHITHPAHAPHTTAWGSTRGCPLLWPFGDHRFGGDQ